MPLALRQFEEKPWKIAHLVMENPWKIMEKSWMYFFKKCNSPLTLVESQKAKQEGIDT